MQITGRPHFRFEDLDVWQDASELTVICHGIADSLTEQKWFRYAEQLRAAGLSPSNNIARRSTAELASMALTFGRIGFLPEPAVLEILEGADKVGGKPTGLIRHLGL